MSKELKKKILASAIEWNGFQHTEANKPSPTFGNAKKTSKQSKWKLCLPFVTISTSFVMPSLHWKHLDRDEADFFTAYSDDVDAAGVGSVEGGTAAGVVAAGVSMENECRKRTI